MPKAIPIDGTKLKELRLQRFWTQRELGEKIDVDAQTVRGWEKGMKAPSAVNLRALASALGVSPDDLLFPDRARVPVEAGVIAVGTATVSGPADLLARVAQGLDAADEQDAPIPSAIANAERPNPRHTGIHELLDLVDAGKSLPGGIVLSAEEEEGLRTYGRSGPAVDNIGKACELVLTWRGWQIR